SAPENLLPSYLPGCPSDGYLTNRTPKTPNDTAAGARRSNLNKPHRTLVVREIQASVSLLPSHRNHKAPPRQNRRWRDQFPQSLQSVCQNASITLKGARYSSV